MSLILFWKTLTELSLYFSIAHFVGSLAGSTGDLLRNSLILSAAAMIAAAVDRKGWTKWRYAALLALIPAFYLTGSMIDKGLLLIPAMYTVLMVHRRIGDTSYYEYQRQYKMGLKILCVVGVLLLMAWQHPAVADFVLPHVFCYLVGGVLALRLLRHSDNMQSSGRLWLHNILSLLPVGVAALLVSSPAAGRAALAVLKFIFNRLIYPIIALFTYIMSWIMYAIFTVVSKIDFGEGEGMQELQQFAMENTEKIMEQGEINTLPTDVILGAILVLIFGALAWMMLKFLRKSSDVRQNSISEVRTRINDVMESPRDSLFDRTPRAKVRATYRKFIGLCVSAGAKIRRTDTTEDIERLAQYALSKPEGTGDIRDIYRKARYSEAEITDADVSQIKTAYQSAKAHYKKATKV